MFRQVTGRDFQHLGSRIPKYTIKFRRGSAFYHGLLAAVKTENDWKACWNQMSDL